MLMGKISPTMLITVAGIILLLVCASSLFLGHYPASFRELFMTLCGMSPEGISPERAAVLSGIIFDLRLPRVIAAILIGAALSASGTAYQSIFMNPLVSPGVLGVLAGGGFGAALGIIFGFNPFAVQLAASAGGLSAVLAALLIARVYNGDRLLMLILGGIISGAFFTAMLALIKYAADPNDELPAITYWLMGSLSGISFGSIISALPVFGIGIFVLLLSGKTLNVLSLGEEARALGVNPQKLRLIMITAATLLSVTSIALAGIIGWIGLIVPHIGRMLTGSDNRFLLPLNALLGGVILLLADDLSRSALTVEIPLGITTSIFGIPLFVLFLRKAKGF
jgi:iron complex transport system permease protein